MAENILGILFVTSSARGRAVFRYPPDPLSASTRLHQPIYPSNTYTAPSALKQALFPSTFADNRKTSASSLRDSYRRLGRPFGEGSTVDGESLHTRGGSSSGAYVDPEDADDPDSDSDDDHSEYNAYGWNDGSRDGNTGGGSTATHPPTTTAGTSIDGGTVNGDSTGNHSSKPTYTYSREHYEAQYNYAYNYSLDFLSDMLTPPRSACNRRFELCVEELVFLGHPVSIGPDGIWTFPEEDDAVNGRGRRGRTDPTVSSNLRTVMEGREVSPESSSKSEDKDGPPILNMFHLVVILDKPDPKIYGQVEGTDLFDEVYREIVFKWTAAAWALQVKDNFVAKASWEMARVRDRCLNDSVPIIRCCQILYEANPLERALCDLYNAIDRHQTSPINPLYAHLPTTITIPLADMSVNMILSPRSGTSEEAWAHWGELADEESESDSDESDDWIQVLEPRPSDLRVEPWQTLLLIEEDLPKRADEVAQALIVAVSIDDNPVVSVSGDQLSSRRGSKETQAEQDESALMKVLIEACDVKLSLDAIARVTRFDLDGIVIPLARDLVQNKKAILIDVLNTRMRTLVMLTTIAEHNMTLKDYTYACADQFPSVPPLPIILSQLSSAPREFREIIPEDGDPQVYFDLLLWLLRHDLLVQGHTRARIYARPEVKEMAWRNLWTRRRQRWLTSQNTTRKTSTGTTSSSSKFSNDSQDLITPKAIMHVNPLSNSNSGFQGPGGMEQSFMDYDPDLEIDSDLGEGENIVIEDMIFDIDRETPDQSDIPHFSGSFIFKPGRAHKDEARWLRVIRQSANDIWAAKFDLCVQYFDGIATFEEISYRTNLQKREIHMLMKLFSSHVVTFVHP